MPPARIDGRGLVPATRLYCPFDCFHDLEGGEGVIGSIEKLGRRQRFGRPIARRDALRFSETSVEHGADRGANADMPFVAAFAEDRVEVEYAAERHAQTGSDLSPVIPQSEPDLQDLIGSKQIGHESPALRSMELEDEGAVPQGKLDNVRTATFLTSSESGFRFRIEPSDARRHDLTARLLDRLGSLREVNVLQGQALEGLE